MLEQIGNITEESFLERYSVEGITSYISVENFLTQKYGFIGFPKEQWVKELEVLGLYWSFFKQCIDLSLSNVVMYRDEQENPRLGLLNTNVDSKNYTFTQFGTLSHTVFSFLERENK